MGQPLITSGELLAAWPLASALDPGDQADLIVAATDVCNNYCGKILGRDTFDQIFYPDGRTGQFYLRHRPVVSIARVSTGERAVCIVQNLDPGTSTATVNLTTDGNEVFPAILGLTLNRTSGGVASSQAILFSSVLTVGSLITTINGLGNGWYAYGDAVWTGFATSELSRDFGAKGAYTPYYAQIYAYTEVMDPVETDFQTGMVRIMRWGLPSRVRCTYSAGWATADVPKVLKRACIATVKWIQEQTVASQKYAEESYGDRSFKRMMPFESTYMLPPPHVCAMLAPFRDRGSF